MANRACFAAAHESAEDFSGKTGSKGPPDLCGPPSFVTSHTLEAREALAYADVSQLCKAQESVFTVSLHD
jgi:hypothetical protein